jgi:hypothetical protein
MHASTCLEGYYPILDQELIPEGSCPFYLAPASCCDVGIARLHLRSLLRTSDRPKYASLRRSLSPRSGRRRSPSSWSQLGDCESPRVLFPHRIMAPRCDTALSSASQMNTHFGRIYYALPTSCVLDPPHPKMLYRLWFDPGTTFWLRPQFFVGIGGLEFLSLAGCGIISKAGEPSAWGIHLPLLTSQSRDLYVVRAEMPHHIPQRPCASSQLHSLEWSQGQRAFGTFSLRATIKHIPVALILFVPTPFHHGILQESCQEFSPSECEAL